MLYYLILDSLARDKYSSLWALLKDKTHNEVLKIDTSAPFVSYENNRVLKKTPELNVLNILRPKLFLTFSTEAPVS